MLRTSQYCAKQYYLEAKRRATERTNTHKIQEREQCEEKLAPAQLAAKIAAEKAARLRAKRDALIAEKRRIERLLESKPKTKLGMINRDLAKGSHRTKSDYLERCYCNKQCTNATNTCY